MAAEAFHITQIFFLRWHVHEKKPQCPPPRHKYDIQVEWIHGVQPQAIRAICLLTAKNNDLNKINNDGLASGNIHGTVSPWASPPFFSLAITTEISYHSLITKTSMLWPWGTSNHCFLPWNRLIACLTPTWTQNWRSTTHMEMWEFLRVTRTN